MSIERTKSKQKVKEPKTKITWKEIKRQKVLLFWAAIMVWRGFLLPPTCRLDYGVSKL